MDQFRYKLSILAWYLIWSDYIPLHNVQQQNGHICKVMVGLKIVYKYMDQTLKNLKFESTILKFLNLKALKLQFWNVHFHS